jgi:hypothetical protein
VAKKKKSDGKAPKGSPGSKSAWKLMDRGSTIAAGLLAREVSALTWRAATGKKPPTSDRHPDTEVKEAVAWAVVGGALAELVRLLVRRSTATYYVKSTGHLPPGMKPLNTAGDADGPTLGESAQAVKKAGRKISRRSRGR